MVIPVNTDRFNQAARAHVQPVVSPDFSLDVVNISGGFEAIQGRYSLQENAQHVVDLIRRLSQGPQGLPYDGVFVSDFDGCGVEVCRELLSVPVVDGFGPPTSIAITLAETFSIITPDDKLVGLDLLHPRAMALGRCFASVRPMGLSVAQLGDQELVVEQAFEQSREAIRHDGAQAIVLGCTAMLGVADPLAHRLAAHGLPVPVVDPNWAGVTYLQILVRCGLSQSRQCYPMPSELTATAKAAPGRS
jgi:allantoin racemase